MEKLAGWLEKAAGGRRRESHSGGAREAHDAATAERLTLKGMKALRMSEAGLQRSSKAEPEKVALAWWLRRRTSVSLRWVAQRLQMGQYTRVSQAVSRMNRKPGRKLRALREKLVALEPENKSVA